MKIFHHLVLSFLFLSVLFFAGCAKFTPGENTNMDEYTHTKTISVDRSNYILGKKSKCNVGNEIIKVDKYKNIEFIKEYRLMQTKYQSKVDYKKLKKNEIYIVEGVDKEKDTVFIKLFEDTDGKKYIRYDTIDFNLDENLFDSSGNVIVDDYFTDEFRKSKPFLAITVPYKINDESSIEKEHKLSFKGLSYSLIYNGKDSNVIRIQYREFIDDISRPAFYQDLTYDLKESKIFRFKNFKIEVFKSTNEEIEYAILEDGMTK